jgi:hypothetical protein
MLDPVSVGLELYGIYKLVKFGMSAFRWAEQHDKLNWLENELERLKSWRPASSGYPEWAKADGTFDQRRRPYPAMKLAISQLKEACKRKDKQMLFSIARKLAPGVRSFELVQITM